MALRATTMPPDRNGTERASRTGIGHDGARHHRGRAHQQLHRLPDVVDVVLLNRRIGPNILVKRHGLGQQRNLWGRPVGVEVGLQFLPAQVVGIDVFQRFFEPLAGPEPPCY